MEADVRLSLRTMPLQHHCPTFSQSRFIRHPSAIRASAFSCKREKNAGRQTPCLEGTNML